MYKTFYSTQINTQQTSLLSLSAYQLNSTQRLTALRQYSSSCLSSYPSSTTAAL